MIYRKSGGGRAYSVSPLPPPSNSPAAKFASQGDAHVRTDAQIKFLYVAIFFRVFLNILKRSDLKQSY